MVDLNTKHQLNRGGITCIGYIELTSGKRIFARKQAHPACVCLEWDI
jgi:hypothetical protein